MTTPVATPKYMAMAGIGTIMDMLGIEPLALLWGLIGGFVIQSFRRSDQSTIVVLSKVVASGFVAAACATPLALWIVGFDSFDAARIDLYIRVFALILGAGAQAIVLGFVDSVPSVIRAQIERWRRGGG